MDLHANMDVVTVAKGEVQDTVNQSTSGRLLNVYIIDVLVDVNCIGFARLIPFPQ